MAIAKTLESYMKQEGVEYDVTRHPHSHSSNDSAELAHVTGDRLAKAVLLEDEQGYLLAVVPASHRVELGMLRRQLHRNLGLATEEEASELFNDCDVGAIPPLGAAYGVETVMDESLAQQPDVYFEAGDHEELIHVSGRQFQALLADAGHGRFSHHA